MKQCTCSVGWRKWECFCVDPAQRPVGPGSAIPTKVSYSSTKVDDCACLCTADGGNRRRVLSELSLAFGSDTHSARVADGEATGGRRLMESCDCTTCVSGGLPPPSPPYYICGGPGDTCSNGCGDGARPEGSSEQCDDSNIVEGDGCSRTCQVECGWACSGGNGNSADVCSAAKCGDRMLAGVEECDDGNLQDGDGCSSLCIIEFGFTCVHYSVPPYPCGAYGDVCSPVCGDGRVVGSEERTCDDGNLASGDGCSPECQVECGYMCAGGNESSGSMCETVCADGLRAGMEGCDDGNEVDGDGCSSMCVLETGFTCSVPMCGTTWCDPICGDGVLQLGQECDDGNRWSFDGCSDSCSIECGWDCLGTMCSGVCGDGMRRGLEECDDGNIASGDGCSSECIVEIGFTCKGALGPVSCRPHI